MNWRIKAACRGMDVDLFFPDRGDMDAIAQAKAVCSACPVSNECLWQAVEFVEAHGVFGGTTSAQRRLIRRAYGIDSYRKPEAKHGTESRYVHYRCQCEPCLQAHRLAVAKRAERAARAACA